MVIALMLAGIVPLYFVLAFFAPVQFSIVLGLLSISCFAFLPRASVGVFLFRPAMIPLFLFFGYASLSAFWSIDLYASVSKTIQLCAVIVCGSLLIGTVSKVPRFERRLVPVSALVSLSAVSFVMIGIMLFELVAARQNFGTMASQLAEYNRFSALLAVVAFPLFLLIYRTQNVRSRAFLVLIAIIAVLFILANLQMSASLAALAISACVWAAGFFSRMLGVATVVGLLVLTILGPFVWFDLKLIPFEELSASFLHRLLIWEFVQSQLHENLLFGWGLDTSPRIPGGIDVVSGTSLGGMTNTLPQWPTLVNAQAQQLPLHPHNAPLQVFLELGLFGLLLAFSALVALLICLSRLRLESADRAAVLAAMASALVLSGTSFGVWQTWWISALLVATIICVLAVRSGSSGGGHE